MRSFRNYNAPKPQRLWQHPDWPHFVVDTPSVAAAVVLARRAQGAIEGRLAAVGFDHHLALAADAWTEDAMSTAAIEGERLDLDAVRSSVARRLGVAASTTAAGKVATPRHVDGLLDVMNDATSRADQPVTAERLHAWQAALFPTGYSGMSKIVVGGWRTHGEPMQIVSGPIGKERVHYEAPRSADVPKQMAPFLTWLNNTAPQDGLVKAAVAHLWFETIHPFEDGNGRVGRAVVDLLLARDMGPASRLLRISQQLLIQRAGYYDELHRAQHGTPDITGWVLWFTQQVQAACVAASATVDGALTKANFWNEHRDKNLNPRQRKVVNLLLDAGPGGFEGGMNTRKAENLTGAARATASRDLIELAELGLLQAVGGGRSTRYQLRVQGWARTLD